MADGSQNSFPWTDSWLVPGVPRTWSPGHRKPCIWQEAARTVTLFRLVNTYLHFLGSRISIWFLLTVSLSIFSFCACIAFLILFCFSLSFCIEFKRVILNFCQVIHRSLVVVVLTISFWTFISFLRWGHVSWFLRVPCCFPLCSAPLEEVTAPSRLGWLRTGDDLPQSPGRRFGASRIFVRMRLCVRGLLI